MTSSVVIRGTGAYVPEKRLTNADLERMVDTSDEWITTRTGISERRIAAPEEATSDMAQRAACAALQDAGVSAADIDLIVVGTSTPDHHFPSVACKLQASIGCTKAAAFDVNAACAGFISALQVAEQFIRAGSAEHVLVVGADTMSRILDYTDRATSILFGDGAGAFVLSRGERGEGGILSSATYADGTYYDKLYVCGGGCTADGQEARAKITMNGRAIFQLAVRAMVSATEEVLAKAGVSVGEVDWVVPHQANQRITDAVAKGLCVSLEKVISTIKDFGNNSAATVPLAMDIAIKDGRIQRGDKVILTAFGGGLSWGSVLLSY